MRAFLHLSPAHRPDPLNVPCNVRRVQGVSVCSARRRPGFWRTFGSWSLLYGAGFLTGWLLGPLFPSVY